MLEYFYIPLLTETLFFAAMASSFNMLIGFGYLFTICQGAFVAVGAYTSAILVVYHGVAFWATVPIAIIVGSIIGALIGLASLRTSGDYLAIATFALQIVLTTILTNGGTLTGGASGIVGIPQVLSGNSLGLLALSAVILIIILEVSRRLKYSGFGMAAFSAGTDAPVIAALGHRPQRMRVQLFIISGACAALVGAIYSSFLGFITPGIFDYNLSILLLMIVIIGGSGTIFGPIIGSVIMVAVPELLTQVGVSSSTVSYIQQIVFGVGVIVVIIFLRRGILRYREPFMKMGRKRFQLGANLVSNEQEELIPNTEALICRGLTKSYGGVIALNNVDIILQPGRVTGIVGPNGAGKTTLFEVLSGSTRASGGEVFLGDRNLTKVGIYGRVHRGVARTFQDLRLFGHLSVFGNVLVAALPQGGDSVLLALVSRKISARLVSAAALNSQNALEEAGIGSDVHRMADDLSYAEQKILSMARIGAKSHKVMLLDEPFAGVSGKELEGMALLIRSYAQRGITVCVIEHNVRVLAGLVDHMIFMNMGRVVMEGTPAEVMSSPELVKIYFGEAQSSL